MAGSAQFARHVPISAIGHANQIKIISGTQEDLPAHRGKTMQITELSELILVRLYDLENEQGGGLHDLLKLGEEFGETSRSKIDQAAKVLEARGLILASFSMVTINAGITGEGSLFVEQGGQTNVIPQYRKDPSSFTIVDHSTHFHGSVSDSNVAVGSRDVTQSIKSTETTTLLNEIHQTLVNDQSLESEARAELLRDVETLRAELSRAVPRQGVLKTILSTLKDVASIGGLIVKLAGLCAASGV